MKIIITVKRVLLIITVFLCFNLRIGYSQACSSPGANLVTNGNFEACTGTCATDVRLNTEFPDYSPSYSTVDCNGGGPTHQMAAGRYSITRDASDCFNTNWWGAGVTGRGGSYAMLVDGNGTASQLWCQTVPVTAGLRYQFIAFLNNPWTNTVDVGSDGPEDLPSIQLTIGGHTITPLVATPTVLGGWDELNCVYTMQASDISGGTTQICINMLSTGSSTGNDILIDDISFTTVSTCPAGTCGYTGVTLPANLLFFEARESGYDALINWSSTWEDKLSGYVVEKSTDGIHFYELGKVDAIAPNYNAVQNYQLKDDHFTKTTYYRLRIEDLDGKTYYSQIKKLIKKGDKVIIVRTETGVEIKALVNDEAEWHMTLYSAVGQELVNKTLLMEKGEHLLMSSGAQSNRGSEILRITDNEGEVIFSELILW